VSKHRPAAVNQIKCPICRKETRQGDPFFPFCSQRCKLVDLGAWATGRYRISGPLKAQDGDPEAAGDLSSTDSDLEVDP